MSKWMIALLITLMPSPVFAHSGHGHIDVSSIWHWLLEFEHIGWMIPLAIIVVWLVRKPRSGRKRA